MPFAATLKTPEPLKLITAAVDSLVEEATFEATPEGLQFRGMDPAHIALIDVFLPAGAFEKYECPASVKFAVKTAELNKALKRGDKKDSLHMRLTDDAMIEIAFNGSYQKSFKHKLLETNANSTPLPKLNFAAKAVLPVAAFGQIIDDLLVSGEQMTFSAKPTESTLLLSAKGDSGEALVTLSKILSGDNGHSILEDLQVKDEAKAAYSIDYFAKMVKGVQSGGGSLALEWTTKMPLRIEVPVANVGRIHFYMAPRVQE